MLKSLNLSEKKQLQVAFQLSRNGNPQSLESYNSDKRKYFYGKAILIIRAEMDNEGSSKDLKSASPNLKVLGCNLRISTSKSGNPFLGIITELLCFQLLRKGKLIYI